MSKEARGIKVTYMLTTIFVGVKHKIKDTNGKTMRVHDIKPRDKATIDYRIENGMLAASNIVIGKYE